MMRAVIDRFEGELAVLLVGDEEVRLNVPRDQLPRGAGEGSWLRILFRPDEEGTERQRQKVSDMLDRLKRRGRGED